MKNYITIACLALFGILAYLLWPTNTSVAEPPTPVVEKSSPEAEKRVEPVATKPQVVWKQVSEPTPAPIATEDQGPETDPVKPNNDEGEERFVESQDQLHAAFNEFVEFADLADELGTYENDDDRELVSVAISEAGRRLADLMIETGTPQISHRGWNFFVTPDGNYDYGKNPDGP